MLSSLFRCLPAGRIDRKIEFPLPDDKTRKRIFQIHTNKMTLADDVNLVDYVAAKDDLSGADIKVCVKLHCIVHGKFANVCIYRYDVCCMLNGFGHFSVLCSVYSLYCNLCGQIKFANIM